MSNGQLFVSFWDLALENLPEGTFRHRRLAPEEAKRLIDAARRVGSLYGTSQDDLLEPHQKQEKDSHEKLCRVLGEHYGTILSLADFMIEDEEDGKIGYMTRPIQFAEVRGTSRLLVVSCNFVDRGLEFELDVHPPSVTFHLFEAVGAGDAG